MTTIPEHLPETFSLGVAQELRCKGCTLVVIGNEDRGHDADCTRTGVSDNWWTVGQPHYYLDDVEISESRWASFYLEAEARSDHQPWSLHDWAMKVTQTP